MDDGQDPSTSATLLARLRCQPMDQAAWEQFVERYSRKIYSWCCRWHLQPADAEDVTQDVLLKLAEKMRTFPYDPSRSFRAWIHTVTRHAWSDFIQSRKDHAPGNHHANGVALLNTLPAREDLFERLKEEYDMELLEEAMARVRLRVEPRTWEAFRLHKIEGRPGAEIAAILPMRVATVFVAAGKVLRKLQAEIRRLEGPGPEGRENAHGPVPVP